MALQYSRCGEGYHHALQAAAFHPLLDASAHRPSRLDPRADHRRGGRWISANGENGMSSAWVVPSVLERSFDNLVARRHYSGLLRTSRRRHHHELRMRTRDRVFLSISEWVFRRVNDPLVEIDPVTVNTAIIAEQQGGGPIASVATGPSSFGGHRLPGVSSGAKRTALIAAIFLLLAALLAAAILAMQGKKKTSNAIPVEKAAADAAPTGSTTNGVAREEVPGDSMPSFREAESDEAVVRQSQSVATSSPDNQPISPKPPIPHYSTALEQADLPLPPSLVHSAGTKGPEAVDIARSASVNDAGSTIAEKTKGMAESVKEDSSTVRKKTEELAESVKDDSSTVEKKAEDLEEFVEEEKSSVNDKKDDAVESIENALQEEPPTSTGDQLLLPEAGDQLLLPEASRESHVDEKVLSSNGVMSASGSTVGNAAVALESAATEDTASNEHSAQPATTGPSESFSLAPEPSEAETATEDLADESGDQEYVLIGDSSSLSSISDMPTRLSAQVGDLSKRKAERSRPSAVKVAQESAPVGKSSAQPLSEKFSSESFSEKRRKESIQLLERTLPAVSVGAGVIALSSLSGVDGAFEVVGALAAASVLTRDFMWARPREKLLQDVRNIKDHKQLVGFLKDRKIIPEAWYQ